MWSSLMLLQTMSTGRRSIETLGEPNLLYSTHLETILLLERQYGSHHDHSISDNSYHRRRKLSSSSSLCKIIVHRHTKPNFSEPFVSSGYHDGLGVGTSAQIRVRFHVLSQCFKLRSALYLKEAIKFEIIMVRRQRNGGSDILRFIVKSGGMKGAHISLQPFCDTDEGHLSRFTTEPGGFRLRSRCCHECSSFCFSS